MLAQWQLHQYIPKKIWIKGYGGTKRGAYHIYALTQRLSKENAYTQARLFVFTFYPHQDRKDLYVSRIPSSGIIPENTILLLKFFTKILLENPMDWKEGEKKIFYSQHQVGLFCIEQGFCFIPDCYKQLLYLDQRKFEATVDDKHPLFSLLNNETKDFDKYRNDPSFF